MRNVRVKHHVTQLQYVEPQENHNFSVAIISVTVQLWI
jgi:hypothetical protein